MAWRRGAGEETEVKAVSSPDQADRALIGQFLDSDYVKQLIAMTLDAKPDTAIIPLQDYLEMGAEARVNRPSTLGGNWVFRFTDEDFTEETAECIRRMTEESHRARKQ
jgi:4-alpha-glucanotransferase